MSVMTGFRIYMFKELAKIPEGTVVTIPQLARLADAPGARDAVRRILNSDQARDHAFWRVVEEDGSLIETIGGPPDHQREKLQQEDVAFVDEHQVDLDAHQFQNQDKTS